LTLSTTASSASITHGSASATAWAAVSHSISVPTSMETAIPRQPWVEPVNVAPTVPECRIACPVLMPRLMPDSTRSGGGPNAPRAAIKAMKAGTAWTP